MLMCQSQERKGPQAPRWTKILQAVCCMPRGARHERLGVVSKHRLYRTHKEIKADTAHTVNENMVASENPIYGAWPKGSLLNSVCRKMHRSAVARAPVHATPTLRSEGHLSMRLFEERDVPQLPSCNRPTLEPQYRSRAWARVVASERRCDLRSRM